MKPPDKKRGPVARTTGPKVGTYASNLPSGPVLVKVVLVRIFFLIQRFQRAVGIIGKVISGGLRP